MEFMQAGTSRQIQKILARNIFAGRPEKMI
jgi:hypothetical protein